MKNSIDSQQLAVPSLQFQTAVCFLIMVGSSLLVMRTYSQKRNIFHSMIVDSWSLTSDVDLRIWPR